MSHKGNTALGGLLASTGWGLGTVLGQKLTGRLRPCPKVAYCPKTVFSRRGSPTLCFGITLLYIV